MREYGITLLSVFKYLPKMARGIEQAVDRRAINAFHSASKSTLEQAEELCAMIAEKQFYRDLFVRLKEVILSLTAEQRLLLEFKYFRKKGSTKYADIDTSSRTYYRRQNRAYDAFMVALLSRGMSQKWFNANALACDMLKEKHRRVLIDCMRLSRASESRRRTVNSKRQALSACSDDYS